MERPAILRRLVVAAASLSLSACASDAALRKELSDVREQMRVLREAHRRAEQRLDRLEQEALVSRAAASAGSGSAGRASSGAAASEAAGDPGVPSLTVVKLRPKKDPAPSLSTTVAVIEPDPAAVDELLVSASDAPPAMDIGGESVDPSLKDIEYDAAVAALRTGNVAGGVDRLRRFAAENPRHPRADNALYFAGVGLLGMNDFKGAAELLEGLVSTYPAGDAVTEALLRLAECRLKLDQVADARAIYNRLVSNFPGTSAATQAQQRLAALSRSL